VNYPKIAPMEKPKSIIKLKFDNRIRVSYPNDVYEGVRKWTYRKGISAQDLQRKAMEFYLNHLEMDYIQLQKEIKKL
jgi:hypothetical protein